MRNLLFLFGFIFLSFALFAQAKKREVSVNFGFHQTNSKGAFGIYYFDEGGYVTDQVQATFFDFNVLVSKPVTIKTVRSEPSTIKRLKKIYGLGFNQKGFTQKGMASDGTANYNSYSVLFKRTYLSLYLGLSYDIVSYKKIKISIGTLFNPDIDLQNFSRENYLTMKSIAFASRSFFGFQYAISSKVSIRFSPYFQYALSAYNKRLKNKYLDDYKPYGFGFNLGFVF